MSDPKLDPDPKFPEKSDPDPKKIISDPQHCCQVPPMVLVLPTIPHAEFMTL